MAQSPSSRRAWIEIIGRLKIEKNNEVALLAEGVDRNFFDRARAALEKQSPSSRRAWIEIKHTKGVQKCLFVALLAEGVDRNWPSSMASGGTVGSPSSRRAWIEIHRRHCGTHFRGVALLAEGVDRNRLLLRCNKPQWVALLAEGVDRNVGITPARMAVSASPSSRRAWIEITSRRSLSTACSVALLAEGVDRNLCVAQDVSGPLGRPPRGGRG